jgi:hypothetical protein
MDQVGRVLSEGDRDEPTVLARDHHIRDPLGVVAEFLNQLAEGTSVGRVALDAREGHMTNHLHYSFV